MGFIALDAVVDSLVEEQLAWLAAVGVLQAQHHAGRAIQIATSGEWIIGAVG
ncbi:hypothetical protein D3C78_1603620 [compost metagenome]